MTNDALKHVKPNILELVSYKAGLHISEILRKHGINKVIKLASNENPLGTSPQVAKAIEAEISKINRYPNPAGTQLKQKLSEVLSVDPQQITLGNGSGEILTLVGTAFMQADSEVIFSKHSFALYPIVTQTLGAKIVEVPTANYQHDFTMMLTAITDNTRVIFIDSPSNPLGSLASAKQLQQFIEAVPPHIIVLIDEAYYEYAAQSPNYGTMLPLLDQHPNLVITRSFSKAYGLAGLRIGYGVASQELTEIFNRYREPFNTNNIAQAAAIAALNDQDHLKRSLALNQAGMEMICSTFKELGLEFIESGTNFITFDLGKPAQSCYEKLLSHGIILRLLDSYGLPNHLRVTIGLPEENEAFIQALKQSL